MELNSMTVALVTGGASGLGAATAAALAESGAKVAILDLPSTEEAAVRHAPDGVRFIPVDVTDVNSVASAVAAVSDWGDLRVAVNCAGVAGAERIFRDGVAHSAESFERAVGVNLHGSFNVLREAVKAMMRSDSMDGERGVIINTASIAAFDGQTGQIAYSASKAAVVGMTLPAARDLAEHSIRVMTIAPGTFQTPLLAGLPEKARERLEASVPSPRRLGAPDEFAGLVLHIVRNSYLNGETIRLDGGLRMGFR